MENGLSRRDFFKGAAVGALSLSSIGVLSGCTAASQPASAEEKQASYDWSEAADVIIVGGGGSGFCAAIEAGRAGASVLILEKSGVCGGDTLLSGGFIMAGGTEYQKSIGITDTKEQFAEQQLRYLGSCGDPEMVREMALASPDEVQFLLDLGRVFDGVVLMPPAWEYDTDETWARRTHTYSDHRDHFKKLQETVDKMSNVKYYTDIEVTNLATNDKNEVIGVRSADGDYFRANKGVVITTASFGRNKEMSRRYNPMEYWALDYLDQFGLKGNVEQAIKNTGDGIRMAQEIGADLALSAANCIFDCIYTGSDNPPQDGIGDGSIYSTILVNDDARRFVQENALWGYVSTRVYSEAVRKNATEPEKCRFYYITDAVSVEKSPLINSTVNDLGYVIQPGFSKYVLQADTIEELAEKTGLPVDNLKETVSRWNHFCEIGEDKDFFRRNINGRDEMRKIEKAPYYAILYFPLTVGSFGGLRTNKETQVMHVNGKEIPRLYAAGSTMSGMYIGNFYNSCGWSILGTVHWGRKAGRHAAGLEPWTTEKVEAKEQAKPVAAAKAGSYKAGVYTAVGKGRNGDIPVTVEFSDTAILSVTIGENSETEGIGTAAIEKLPQNIIAAQSADIDAISGATLTSQAILDAVKDCIKQASK